MVATEQYHRVVDYIRYGMGVIDQVDPAVGYDNPIDIAMSDLSDKSLSQITTNRFRKKEARVGREEVVDLQQRVHTVHGKIIGRFPVNPMYENADERTVPVHTMTWEDRGTYSISAQEHAPDGGPTVWMMVPTKYGNLFVDFRTDERHPYFNLEIDLGKIGANRYTPVGEWEEDVKTQLSYKLKEVPLHDMTKSEYVCINSSLSLFEKKLEEIDEAEKRRSSSS